MALPPNPDVECKVYVFVMYVIVLGSLCVFGLVGNTLSFLVLQWEKRSHVATFLLRVLALVDNFYLITTGSTLIFSALMSFVEHSDNPVQPYFMVLVWPLVYIAQMATVWMTVLIAFNRYVAICRPFQAPLLCTMKKTRIQLACLGAFIVVYNIPRFCEFTIVHQQINNETTIAMGVPTDLKQNRIYNIVYENILYCLFIFLGPLVILIVFNTCLIRELIAVRQRMIQRHLPASGEDEENNLTLVMIIIILIFLLCQAPAFVNQMLSLKLPYECGIPYYYFYQLSNVVASLNSCLNFVVYCAFRKQFRQRLRAFCLCGAGGGKRSLEFVNAYNNTGGETVTMYVSDSRSGSNSKPPPPPVNGNGANGVTRDNKANNGK